MQYPRADRPLCNRPLSLPLRAYFSQIPARTALAWLFGPGGAGAGADPNRSKEPARWACTSCRVAPTRATYRGAVEVVPSGEGQNGCACEADGSARQTENRPSPGPAAQRNQATLRHPERSIYRCFLTDLAGFTDICRAGPNCAERQGGEKTGLFRSFSLAGSAFADQCLLYTCPRTLVKIDSG